MKLNDYFKQPGALSVRQLRERIGARKDDQVRQWQHGYAGRRPSPSYCVAIERATGGQVRRWDLREDWAEQWPELVGVPGAPEPTLREGVTA